jgi:hypothetical protein
MSALNLTDKDKTNSGANLNVNTRRLDETQIIENINHQIVEENTNKI